MVARLDCDNVATAMAFDHGSDCGSDNVETLEQPRRRGLRTCADGAARERRAHARISDGDPAVNGDGRAHVRRPGLPRSRPDPGVRAARPRLTAAIERSELVVQAAGDRVAERSLGALDVSLCSLPVCSLGGAGRCRPQRVVGIGDAVLKAVGLDAMFGLVPGASRARLLWEWSERDRQIGRGGRIEGARSLLVTERTSEPRLPSTIERMFVCWWSCSTSAAVTPGLRRRGGPRSSATRAGGRHRPRTHARALGRV